MDEEASIQDFLIKRHKWDKVSKKYVLIELLSCLEVDFNYHEPIVQKSIADTRGRDACKLDRLVLTATAPLRTGIQGQSMLVSFNPLCSGEQKHICQTTKQPQHARLRISGCHYHEPTYLTSMGRIDGHLHRRVWMLRVVGSQPVSNYKSSDPLSSETWIGL